MLHKMETTPKATSLNHLLEIIKNDRQEFEVAYQNCENPNPTNWDWSALPTFGGTMPADIRARIELEETSEIPLIIDAVIVQINRLKETL
jgi:hypothetical protein